MPSKLPTGLGKPGIDLWRKITADYDLRPDELRVLEDACREVDIIETLETGRQTADIVAKGSMGQVVIHPIYSELRQHRATLASLLRQLKLSDGENASGARGTRATSAREAANARWSTRGA